MHSAGCVRAIGICHRADNRIAPVSDNIEQPVAGTAPAAAPVEIGIVTDSGTGVRNDCWCS